MPVIPKTLNMSLNLPAALLAELVAPGLAQDGQDPPVAGQVASLTTTNNLLVSLCHLDGRVHSGPSDFLSFH